MSYRQELHGAFPDKDDEQPAPPMKSTDPDTQHSWRVTHRPSDANPYVRIDDVTASDAEIEAIAEDAGERAAITYSRELPWQAGRRHAVRLDLRSREGDGSFVYERMDTNPSTHLRRSGTDESICGHTLLAPEPLTDDVNAVTCRICLESGGIEIPRYRITRTSLHDLRIPAAMLHAPAEELAGILATELGPQTSIRDYFVILAPGGGELIRYVGPKATQAPQYAAEKIRNQAYRLAAIERLISHVASSSEDRTASLVGSAVHEIARGARTPEDAVANLLPPEWSTVLSGLTR